MVRHRMSAVFLLILVLGVGAGAIAVSAIGPLKPVVLPELQRLPAPSQIAELQCPAGDQLHIVHSDGITTTFATPEEALKQYRTEIHPQLLRSTFIQTYSDSSRLRYGLVLGGRKLAVVDLVRQSDGGWYPVNASACNSLLTSLEK